MHPELGCIVDFETFIRPSRTPRPAWVSGCRRTTAGVDHQEIEARRERHAAWRLLRAGNASLTLSFLGEFFADARSGRRRGALPQRGRFRSGGLVRARGRLPAALLTSTRTRLEQERIDWDWAQGSLRATG